MAVTINGSAGVTTNSGAVYDSIQSQTAKSATSTSVDFTSIPSWVKRITVMFSGVSTNGSSVIQLQLGSGAVTTSGYSVVGSAVGLSAVQSAQYSSGFGVGDSNAAARTKNGWVQFCLVSSNIWSGNGALADSSSARTDYTAGIVSLSGTLDRVRITTVNGTDTFDAGTINILYE
jgi:hypothetical protein